MAFADHQLVNATANLRVNSALARLEPMQIATPDGGMFTASFTEAVIQDLVEKSGGAESKLEPNQVALSIENYLQLCEKQKQLNKEGKVLRDHMTKLENELAHYLPKYGPVFPLLNGSIKIEQPLPPGVRITVKSLVPVLFRYIHQIQKTPRDEAEAVTYEMVRWVVDQLKNEQSLQRRVVKPKVRRIWTTTNSKRAAHDADLGIERAFRTLAENR